MNPTVRSTYSGPIALAIAGVVFLIIKAVLEAFSYLPPVSALLGTLAAFAFGIAVVWAIILVVLYFLNKV